MFHSYFDELTNNVSAELLQVNRYWNRTIKRGLSSGRPRDRARLYTSRWRIRLGGRDVELKDNFDVVEKPR
jgi:hypothetical protein